MTETSVFAPELSSPFLFSGGKETLLRAIGAGADSLLSLQQPDGHWVFELEADATIPSEYILLDHFLGTVQQPLHEKMAVYLREIQEEHGGWPLFHRGPVDISASVKAYFALKCVGDDIHAPHMVRARRTILEAGGAERANVFTRIQMALFGAVPWRAVPVMPVEIMHLPRWFPFHLHKIAYWSRTVIVPLLVLCAKKPRAVNPRGVRIDELFRVHPEEVSNWHSNAANSFFGVLFRGLDAVLRAVEPFMLKKLRQSAIDKAVAWVHEHLNGEDGLGAIYPAMGNSLMMFATLGYPPENPDRATARKAIDKLVVDEGRRAYCQPCVSPIWDTCLTLHALQESGASPEAIRKGCDWLVSKQVNELKGDWAFWRPDAPPGGWAFQYANPHYPDVDDTAVVGMALDRFDGVAYRDSIDRAAGWIKGLQSKSGGWGAFDADNEYYYLNYIPFADHGALLDPPSADVSARCLSFLAQIGTPKDHPVVAAAIDYLRREQEKEGCWFGRWGTNYIYGTWSVLCALNAIGVPSEDPMICRAVDWLIARQKADGGWGEDGDSYYKGVPKGDGPVSTPSQTAWALLALMAVGRVDNPAVARGIAYLVETQSKDGTWDEQYYTAVGFPRVFYLRYHGYKAFFPVWALSRYKNLCEANAPQVLYGM